MINIAAQKTSQELNELKQIYENFHQMVIFDEIRNLTDFLAEDDLSKKNWLRSWRSWTNVWPAMRWPCYCLNPMTHTAILEIHPGSGRDRKLRTGATCFLMYTRFEMPNGFKVEVLTIRAWRWGWNQVQTSSLKGLMHTVFWNLEMGFTVWFDLLHLTR